MQFKLRLRKSKKRQPDKQQVKPATSETSSAQLPPQKPRSDTAVTGNRNVLFRDNRLPDGSQAMSPKQFISRPRFPSHDNTSARAWSPTPSSIMSGGSNITPVQPSLASYPASYLPNGYPDFDGSGDYLRSHQHSQPTRLGYQQYEIPKPDYPGSTSSNRDSGLDSESRSSSGRQSFLPSYLKQMPSQRAEQDIFSPQFTQSNYRMRSSSVQGIGYNTTSRHPQFTASKNPYDSISKSRGAAFARLQEETVYGQRPNQYANYKMPKSNSYCNISKMFTNEDDTSTYRSGCRTVRERSKQHCSSCSCCENIIEDYGRFNSVSTSTELISPLKTSTMAPLKRTQLETVQPTRTCNWQRIDNTGDAIYKPSTLQPSSKEQPRRYRSISGGLESDTLDSSRTLRQNTGFITKRLPRSSPLRADYDSFNIPLSTTSFCGGNRFNQRTEETPENSPRRESEPMERRFIRI